MSEKKIDKKIKKAAKLLLHDFKTGSGDKKAVAKKILKKKGKTGTVKKKAAKRAPKI